MKIVRVFFIVVLVFVILVPYTTAKPGDYEYKIVNYVALGDSIAGGYGLEDVPKESYVMAGIFRIGFIIGGYLGIIPLMLISSALAGLCTSPVTGDINAVISAASEYTVRTKGKHIEGAMFSCSSLGIKVGGGLGSAISGMLLEASGYVPNAAQQSASTLNMLNFMYLWFPMISIILISIIMYNLKVEKANADWDAEHGVR